MDEDIDGIPIDGKSTMAAGFIPSKWETVDPEQIEAQAITTSKWETLDPVKETRPSGNASDDSFDGYDYNDSSRDIDEERRIRLREVEIKTVQYQDELESGERSLKSGWTVHQQTEHYRRKLMKKSLRELQQDSPQSLRSVKRSASPDDKRYKRSKRSPGYSKRSNDSQSPSRYRKRRSKSRSASNSPKRYNKERSPSPYSRAKCESTRRR